MRRILFAGLIVAAAFGGMSSATADPRCEISVNCVEDLLNELTTFDACQGGVSYCPNAGSCSGSVNVCGSATDCSGGVNVCGNASNCTGLVNLCR